MTIAEGAKKFNNDLEVVKNELKKIQSIKCRLIKQKELKGYENKMKEVLTKEQNLKEIRSYLEPKKVTVTTMTLEQVKDLNYDETIKAIKSIQSKKCNTQYIKDQVEYKQALEIEKMLLEHKETIRPINDLVVTKSSLNDLIENLENLDQNINKEYILEQLKKLTK